MALGYTVLHNKSASALYFFYLFFKIHELLTLTQAHILLQRTKKEAFCSHAIFTYSGYP